MRRNLFIRSLLRQPLRMGLLMLLMGLASFAFFLRTVEFVAVRGQLIALGHTYRSIGFLRGEGLFDDVAEAAAMLAASPYVGFVEQRQTIEGILMGRDEPDWTLFSPDFASDVGVRNMEAIFTGRVQAIRRYPEFYQIAITVIVEEVFAGFPEHVQAEQRGLQIWASARWYEYFSPDGEQSIWRRNREDWEVINGFSSGTFLFRAQYTARTTAMATLSFPRAGGNDWLWVQPLFVDDDGNATWWVDAEDALYYVEGVLAEDIAFMHHNHRGVTLQPVRDMSALPLMQMHAAALMGVGTVGRRGAERFIYQMRPGIPGASGRMLTFDDYVHARPVAVITTHFAHIRQLQVGSSFFVQIPSEQQVLRADEQFADFIVAGVPGSAPLVELELEVVGIVTDAFRSSPMHFSTFGSSYVYIPASLVPDGLVITAEEEWGEPWLFFSFTLADSRREQAFLEAYRERMEEMGFHLALFESGSQEYWAMATPLLLILTFNAITFWAVLVLVLALVVFLFVSQRRREMAVLRVLGASGARVLGHMSVAVLCMAVPMVLIGGAAGWRLALRAVESTLMGLMDVLPQFVPDFALAYGWFALLAGAVLGLLFVFFLVGVLMQMRFSVLAQLQGGGVRAVTIVSGAVPTLPTGDVILTAFAVKTSVMQRAVNTWRFIFRQVFRARFKAGLVFLSAAMFVFLLGWLNESINRAEAHIDYLYDTTAVGGDIMQANPHDRIWRREMGDVIFTRMVDDVRGSGYFSQINVEAGHFRAYIVGAEADGSFPEDWYVQIGYQLLQPAGTNDHVMDVVYGFSHIDLFLERNYVPGYGGVEITFGEGFGAADFVHVPGAMIPTILSEYTLARRGLAVGDYAWLGYTTGGTLHWREVPVRIIGTHNGQLANPVVQNAVFLPVEALEELIGFILMFTHIDFTVDEVYNREMAQVRSYLYANVMERNLGLVPLAFSLNDQRLFDLVAVATQTHLLLELVFPILLAAAMLIAGGVSLYLVLQTARQAAYLHAMGASKACTAAMILTESLLVWLAGALVAIGALVVIGAGFTIVLWVTMGLFVLAVVGCAVAGMVSVVRRPVLEMLQVKE